MTIQNQMMNAINGKKFASPKNANKLNACSFNLITWINGETQNPIIKINVFLHIILLHHVTNFQQTIQRQQKKRSRYSNRLCVFCVVFVFCFVFFKSDKLSLIKFCSKNCPLFHLFVAETIQNELICIFSKIFGQLNLQNKKYKENIA